MRASCERPGPSRRLARPRLGRAAALGIVAALAGCLDSGALVESCRLPQAAEPACVEYRKSSGGVDLHEERSACQGTWAEEGCPRTVVIGGCSVNEPNGAPYVRVDWYSSSRTIMSTDDVRGACAREDAVYVSPGTLPTGPGGVPPRTR